jgi:nitroimidazol reductase NimA-like FMN-containing flavoprotein (pyridoxamine 5'-phosphate oxidase superfamily)
MKAARPQFRELEPDECAALLRSHHVGRLAYTLHDRVDIVPILYVYEDGWLYGRTAAGHKLEVLEHNRWIAFEVDEVEGPFDWRSVVVKGGVHLLRHDGSKEETGMYLKALDVVRSIAPQALTAEDPVPERAILFRIHAAEMKGRAATTK